MAYRIEIPRDENVDSTLAVLKEGYRFIPNRCKKYKTNIFRTRLIGQDVICISGKEAAEIFYDKEKFQRKDAIPKRIQKTLFGKNGIQTMDGKTHQHRKSLFMSLMTHERLTTLADLTDQYWDNAVSGWEKEEQIILLRESEKIMCQIACHWAGVPLKAEELDQRARDLGALIDAFGAVGPRHWTGRMARKRTESWMKGIIAQVRSHQLVPPKNTALYAMAWHRNLHDELINLQIAAVELVNILRPIVAIGRYITFGALALYHYPEAKQALQANEHDYDQMFVQEVRRFYPFAPFLGALVKNDFFWGGHDFKKGTLVLLDIYGTNHSPERWNNPEKFHPERFSNRERNPFDLIPQGGGEYMGHRCAGEWATIAIMKASLNFLANQMDYEVPEQKLEYSLVRMPSQIKSGFIISNVKRK